MPFSRIRNGPFTVEPRNRYDGVGAIFGQDRKTDVQVTVLSGSVLVTDGEETIGSGPFWFGCR
ncbi:MAG: hypothetical protein IPM88_20640 [Nitrospira sp.]|nr:hypothetical protein [Nitrospira sp.]